MSNTTFILVAKYFFSLGFSYVAVIANKIIWHVQEGGEVLHWFSSKQKFAKLLLIKHLTYIKDYISLKIVLNLAKINRIKPRICI